MNKISKFIKDLKLIGINIRRIPISPCLDPSICRSEVIFLNLIKKGQFYYSLFLSFWSAMIGIGLPLTIKVVVDYVKIPFEERDIRYGIFLLIFIFILKILQSFFDCHSNYQFNKMGFNLNNSVCIALYDKCLKVSFISNRKFKSGQIVNLLQSDADKLK
jgi:ATP-binding cassette subfamily C (CFTR/MRP) protein 2